MPWQVVVDQDRCQGHAQCWMYAPDLFELDDLGYAHPTRDELPDEEETCIQHVVAGCPERAITATPA